MMNRGDIKLAIDRCIAYDVPDAAELIESLYQQVAEKNQTILDHVEIQNALRQQLSEANHAHEFMCQQYLDTIKERNQLRKDVAKLQEALHCKLTWKPS